jgi:NitT/TauT family transport system permease protein
VVDPATATDALVTAPATDVGTGPDQPVPRPPTGTRGTRHHAFWRLRGEVPFSLRAGLFVAGLVSLVVLWVWASATSTEGFLVPSPIETAKAANRLWSEGVLWPDLVASVQRVAIGYSISVVTGVALGLLIGSFRSAEAFFEAPIGFLRYIPSTALLPLFLFWLGIDETPKIVLIVVGTVFFNALMMADVVRDVPRELISASYTLGAGRLTVLRRVVFPHSLPGMIDVVRINLAAAWLMLVVAELLAAQEGLAFRIVRAQRFRNVDEMFALLLIFGIIGVVSDLFLRWLRNRSAPWARA